MAENANAYSPGDGEWAEYGGGRKQDAAVRFATALRNLVHGRKDWMQSKFGQKILPLLAEFRKAFADFMFTTSDFEQLIVQKLTEDLVKQRQQSLPRYLGTIARISTPGHKTFINEWITRVMRENNLPSEFEMRIPVAVPTSQLSLNCAGLLEPATSALSKMF